MEIIESYDSTPTTNLLDVLANSGYSLQSAIADIVDNSIQLEQKISGLINMIFFINIYETLYNDMVSEKNLLGKYLDELIQKCDSLISTLNSEKKIQLSNLVSKPNFY